MVLLHDAQLLPLGLETHHFPGLKFARMDFSWTSPVQPVRKNVWALLVFRFPKVLSHVMRLRSCMIRWVSCNHLTGGPPGFWGKIPDPKVETGRNLANQVKLGVAPLLNRRDHFPFNYARHLRNLFLATRNAKTHRTSHPLRPVFPGLIWK